MDTQLRLLTDGEAAAIVRMSRARLVRLAKSGQAPCVRLPDGELRFDHDDLLAWIEEHKVSPEGPEGLGNFLAEAASRKTAVRQKKARGESAPE